MAHSYISKIALERFKSYEERTELELKPLTFLIGRNNSGKSSWIQALLLARQTLRQPRIEVPLSLEGDVDAFSLRELTSGWPKGQNLLGPKVEFEWRASAFNKTHKENCYELLERGPDEVFQAAGLDSFSSQDDEADLDVSLALTFVERRRAILIDRCSVQTTFIRGDYRRSLPQFEARRNGLKYQTSWGELPVNDIAIGFFNFVPVAVGEAFEADYFELSQTNAIAALWYWLVGPALDDLRNLLTNQLRYLSSARDFSPLLFRQASVPPIEIGAKGELAAQLLQSRKGSLIRYPDSSLLLGSGADCLLSALPEIRTKPMLAALNDVLRDLGVVASDLKIEEVHDLGFRLLFGQAPIHQVGRGLGYLLPLIQVCLLADPLYLKRFRIQSRQAYLARIDAPTLIALEEPECHIHPKVQSRLANWFVALAMCGRRLLVETHSDHMVRRVRGLIARCEKGSELEKWLLENVNIAEVTQDETGRSHLKVSTLTAIGGIEEKWPADFMDEGADEERAIFFAGLDKNPPPQIPRREAPRKKRSA